jgi:hypothetical protein
MKKIAIGFFIQKTKEIINLDHVKEEQDFDNLSFHSENYGNHHSWSC